MKNACQVLQRLGTCALVLSSEHDEVVPSRMGEELLVAAEARAGTKVRGDGAVVKDGGDHEGAGLYSVGTRPVVI